MTFTQKLAQRISKVNSSISVGLDPVIDKIPKRFFEYQEPILEFNKWIIKQTHQYVAAYKPNSAFYEGLGATGIIALKQSCEYLQTNYPDIPIILDAKRGDIGHSNAEYAKFAFEYLKADAITLHPYLGSESLKEFFKYSDKGLIILTRTSNPGAGEFQDLLISNIPLWQHIAQTVTTKWQEQTQSELLLVVGATYPQELKQIRNICPQTTFLIPGIGSQGGDLKKVLQFGRDKNGKGIIINSSRGIIYANNPRKAVTKLLKAINSYS